MKTNINLIKKTNAIKILEIIKNKHGISRAEISKITKLTRATVSSSVSFLLKNKYVIETGTAKSTGGKRPVLLKINKNFSYVVGIDIGDENYIFGTITDFNNNIIKKIQLKYKKNIFSEIKNKVFDLIDKLIINLGINNIKAISIAVSGIVVDNEVIFSINFDLVNKKLAEVINNKYNIAVFIENRPNVSVMAEKHVGIAKKYKNIVYVTMKKGIGLGIIINNKIFRGSFGGAGEIGNIKIEKTQTIEEVSRIEYLLSEINKKINENTKEEMFELYKNKDKDLTKIINKQIKYLASVLSFVSNLLNPEIIILGENVLNFGDRYLENFKKYFYENIFYIFKDKIKIKFSCFDKYIAAYGAGLFVINKIFKLEI